MIKYKKDYIFVEICIKMDEEKTYKLLVMKRRGGEVKD